MRQVLARFRMYLYISILFLFSFLLFFFSFSRGNEFIPKREWSRSIKSDDAPVEVKISKYIHGHHQSIIKSRSC